MKQICKVFALMALLVSVLAFPASGQTPNTSSLFGDYTFSFGQSVVASDGTMYSTVSYWTFSWGSFWGSSSTTTQKDSELNAYGLTSDKDGHIKFPGYASKLAVGANNLYLIVTPSSSDFSSTPTATLYIINGIVPSAAPGINVESIARAPVSSDGGDFAPVVKVQLPSVLPGGKALSAGYVTELLVKTVDGKEYAYIKTATYDKSFNATKQLTIYDSKGVAKRGPFAID